MTADDTARLDEWAALADAATEGPWLAEYSAEAGTCVLPHDAESTAEAVALTRLYLAAADAAFIAAAREAVPALIAMVRERDEEIAEYDAILTREGDLLTGVANALHGPPPPLVSWSHHDLPAAVAALRNPTTTEETR